MRDINDKWRAESQENKVGKLLRYGLGNGTKVLRDKVISQLFKDRGLKRARVNPLYYRIAFIYDPADCHFLQKYFSLKECLNWNFFKLVLSFIIFLN